MTPDADDPTPPPIKRRLACFAYEGVLLFGVVMIAGLLYSILADQRHALQGTWGMQLALFLVFGAYFVHFWSHTGQTLAMQTWHIRVVSRDGQRLSRSQAAARYLLSWLWFLPALGGLKLAGLQGWGPFSAALIAGVLAYALLARLRPDRQYFHDVICGTRLITWRKPPTR